MTRPIIALGALVLALGAVACGGGGGEKSPTATPTSAATEPTGIADVDTVIATLFSGDEAAVRSLIDLTGVACEAEPIGIGAPPQCPEGVADGTTVDVFPMAQCEGFYVFPDDLDGTVAPMARPGPKLEAVYETRGDIFWAHDGYAAVYTGVGEGDQGNVAYAVGIHDGAIVGVHLGCGMTPREFADFFELGAPVWSASAAMTGIEAADEAIAAVEMMSPESILMAIQPTQVACATEPEPLSGVPPCDGEPDGTLVDAFASARCEGAFVPLVHSAESVLDVMNERPDSRFYALYGTDGSIVAADGRSFLAPAGAQYVVVFAVDAESANAWGLLLTDEGIVGVVAGCQENASEFIADLELTDAIVPPEG